MQSLSLQVIYSVLEPSTIYAWRCWLSSCKTIKLIQLCRRETQRRSLVAVTVDNDLTNRESILFSCVCVVRKRASIFFFSRATQQAPLSCNSFSTCSADQAPQSYVIWFWCPAFLFFTRGRPGESRRECMETKKKKINKGVAPSWAAALAWTSG
jgi:hypothetical protein